MSYQSHEGITRKGGLPDNIFIIITAILLGTGIFVFMSASFGLLARDGAEWGDVLFSQFALGLGGGLLAGLVTYSLPSRWLRRSAFYLFLAAILACLLVFVDGIGFSAGGAARWIHVAGFSIQPSEFLKIAMILFLSTWLSTIGSDVKSLRFGLVPFLGIIALVGILIIAEPDTGTFMVMLVTACSMFLIAGGKILHIVSIIVGAILLVGVLATVRPYVRERIVTYINPASDPQGSGYQIRQSLIAIGSGGLTGRGFGQSVQKYQYLPEPIGDSIFAVLAEEFGLIGSLTVIILFGALGLRGLSIATRVHDPFNRLAVSGLVIMIVAQAFLNIGALTGLAPLTGIPLPFVSHGGTSLMFMLVAVAIILSFSRYQVFKIKAE